jgi:osmotically-inducible protein OsmY
LRSSSRFIAKDKQPMQRAGNKRPVSVRAIPATPSVTALKVVAFSDERTTEAPVDIELLPNVQAIACVRPAETETRDARHRTLELAIRQRIESRLMGRVRNLLVRALDGVVILEGECTTFYTKQLAQHAAMGMLEDEQLENSIVVSVQ